VAKTSKNSGQKTIRVPADLRIAAAGAAYSALQGAAAGPSGRIALDASQVEKVDAAGIQALLGGRRVLEQSGKQLSWTGISPQLKAAAQLLGLAEALELSE
jgi:anti-anti-sigma regulatory factor